MQAENRIEKLVFWDIENIPAKYGQNFVEYIAAPNAKVLTVFSTNFQNSALEQYTNLNKIAYNIVNKGKDAADNLIKQQFENFLSLYTTSKLKFKELVLITNDKVLIQYFKEKSIEFGVCLKLYYTQKIANEIIKKNKLFDPIKLKIIQRKTKKIKNLNHINMPINTPVSVSKPKSKNKKKAKQKEPGCQLLNVYGGRLTQQKENNIIGMYERLKDKLEASYQQRLKSKKAQEYYSKISISNYLKEQGNEITRITNSTKSPQIKINDTTYLDCIAIDLTGKQNINDIKNKIIGSISAKIPKIYEYRDKNIIGKKENYVLVINYIDPQQLYTRAELIEDIKQYLKMKNKKNMTKLERFEVLSGIIIMNDSLFEEKTLHKDFIYNQYKKEIKVVKEFSKGFNKMIF